MSSNLLTLARQASIRCAHYLPRGTSVSTKRFYKLSVGSIKKGQIVQFKDKPWKVLTRDHVSTGRGGAVVKMELQDILSPAKINERFKSGDSLESKSRYNVKLCSILTNVTKFISFEFS